MGKIENEKTYSGKDLDTIFFRPMLTGRNAEELGIRVMYNTPVPARLHFWKRTGEVLQPYTTGGWSGGKPAKRYQKEVLMSRVKAEVGYSADDYFNYVYELITNRADVNMDDLSGTELEQAETQLFREAIAESIRATMWLGNTAREGTLNTFDGFVRNIVTDAAAGVEELRTEIFSKTGEGWAESLLGRLWTLSCDQLKGLRQEGQLVFFVTSDIYNAYEENLDNVVLDAAYMAKQQGRDSLSFRGIPVVDIQVGGYLPSCTDLPRSFALLTDRRNMALFVNTDSFPGTEVRMWYNPDQMENRQRAVFMAGCDYLLPELLVFAANCDVETEATFSSGEALIAVKVNDSALVKGITARAYNSSGVQVGDDVAVALGESGGEALLTGTEIAKVSVEVAFRTGTAREYTIKRE